MGRRSSDSECDSRSRRKRRHHRKSSSSSSSDSRTSSRRRSGRRSRTKSRSRSGSWSRDHHTRSRSRDRRRRRRSSSDSSYESRKRRSSRSRSRDRARSYRSRHSRSRSRARRHRPRSHSRSSERLSRRRSHSWSRERERRKGREKERLREKEREKSKKEIHTSKHGDSGNIKTGLEHLVSSSQAKTKLQIALQAAAKVDALKLKEKTEEVVVKKEEEEQYSLAEQVKRLWDIEAVESDKFIQQEFRSSRDTKKSADNEGKHDPALLGTGSTNASATDVKQEISEFPVSVKYLDDDNLAHPSLFIDKAVAEEQWIKRLVALRQERLMGSPVC